jgi:hypothetical protein
LPHSNFPPLVEAANSKLKPKNLWRTRFINAFFICW